MRDLVITHELIIEKFKFYNASDINRCKKDFEEVLNISWSSCKHFAIVKGVAHLYGYKIEGDGPLSGFYDIFNDVFYDNENIKYGILVERSNDEACVSYRKLKKCRRRSVRYFEL